MKLKAIFHQISADFFQCDDHLNIESIVQHAQKATADSLFVAIKGHHFDGHRFISTAIELGAKAVLCEELPAELAPKISYIRVASVASVLGVLAQNFYQNPSQKLQLIGITGTNGKTTTATLLYELFRNMGYKAGLISTINVRINDTQYPTANTTPDALTLNQYLHQMVGEGVTHCFMEVSSHGVALGRIAGLHFRGGVFTNLTHDHLDFHQSFAAYRDAKKAFFDALPPSAFALTNIDDKNGSFMLQNTRATKRTYALKDVADYKASIKENSFGGLCLNINGREVFSALIGAFNAYNLLSIYGVLSELGVEPTEALRAMSQLKAVQGRFEYLVSPKGVTIIIDYAHTPDALENVLRTIAQVSSLGKIITVVGCGGNRDKTKRPVMAQIAAKMSHWVIFTSDNPREEDPHHILSQMQEGVSHRENYVLIENREEAIKTAIATAQRNDVVLIAGKGHEKYQEIKGVRHYFDDVQQAKKYM